MILFSIFTLFAESMTIASPEFPLIENPVIFTLSPVMRNTGPLALAIKSVAFEE